MNKKDEEMMMAALVRVMNRKAISGIVRLNNTDTVEVNVCTDLQLIPKRKMKCLSTGKKVTVLEWYQPDVNDDYKEYYICKDNKGYLVIIDGRIPNGPLSKRVKDMSLFLEKVKVTSRTEGILKTLLPVEGWKWID